MVTYQQGLENNLKKKTDQKKQITYQENLKKQINQIFFKKKIYCYIPAGPKEIILRKTSTKKKQITYLL